MSNKDFDHETYALYFIVQLFIFWIIIVFVHYLYLSKLDAVIVMMSLMFAMIPIIFITQNLAYHMELINKAYWIQGTLVRKDKSSESMKGLTHYIFTFTVLTEEGERTLVGSDAEYACVLEGALVENQIRNKRILSFKPAEGSEMDEDSNC